MTTPDPPADEPLHPALAPLASTAFFVDVGFQLPPGPFRRELRRRPEVRAAARAVLAGAEARRRRPACDQHEAGHVLDVEPAPLPADPASDCQSHVEVADVIEAIR